MMRIVCHAAWLACIVLTPGPAAAAASQGGQGDGPAASDEIIGEEDHATGWSFYMDNDALTLLSRDQQYTGGFAFTLSGRRAAEYPWSLEPLRQGLDDLTGFGSLYRGGRRIERHSFEVGMTAFTPEDIEERDPIPDEHPYGSVVFVSNTQQTVRLDKRVSYQSTLALGVLGTDIPKQVQAVFHDAIGSQEPRGWRNQISDGGEPTFNYVFNRQQPHLINDDNEGWDYDIRSTIGGSIGYTTQLLAGINWRWGRIRTPWWGFNPDFAEYINVGTPVSAESQGGDAVEEFFFWGTLQVRQRFYNALLEGQFRDSALTFDRDELDSTLGEAAIGVTCGLRGGTRVTFALRAREAELEKDGGREPFWGSLIVSRSF